MGDNINPSSTASINPGGGSGAVIQITSITMVVTSIFIFLVIIFVLFLYFHVYYSWAARATSRRRRWRSSRTRPHFVFAAGDPIPSLGLDPPILLSLPVTIYRARDFKQGLECAVCLSELVDGEKARLLPNCSHGFHLECIDMWFHSHSTCPLCRCPVDGDGGLQLTEPRGLDLERNAAQEQRMLHVSNPAQSAEMLRSSLSPSPSSRWEVVVEISTSTGAAKEAALRRSTSGGKSSSICSSPNVGDIEEGTMGSGEAGGDESPGVLKASNTFPNI